MKNCWKVERVELTTAARERKYPEHCHYKFHVEGENNAGGSLAPAGIDRFAWAVPDILDESFDLSEAEFSPEAAGLAAKLYGLAFLETRTARLLREHSRSELEETQPIPIKWIDVHPARDSGPLPEPEEPRD